MQALFAEGEERRGGVVAFGELGAEVDVAGKRQGRPGGDGFRRSAGFLLVVLLQRVFLGGQRGRVAVVAQRVLSHVREEVADVQRRVAVAVEVEVQPGEVRARVRHEDLVGAGVR